MATHRLPLIGAALTLGVLAFAGYSRSLAPAATAAVKATAIHKNHSKAAPRSVKKAKRLASLAATQLVRDYGKGHAKTVCNSLTTKARKSLGGVANCTTVVRYVRSIKTVSKLKIKKIVFRRARIWASVDGYLSGARKHRLTVTFKWEGGRYRFDHSLSTLIKLFG